MVDAVAAAAAVAVAVAVAAAAALLVEWGRSLLQFEHICICRLISKTRFFLFKHKYREGVRAKIMSMNRHFIEHGNPVPELTLTSHRSWLSQP